jgi:hypothetical protein
MEQARVTQAEQDLTAQKRALEGLHIFDAGLPQHSGVGIVIVVPDDIADAGNGTVIATSM